MGRCMILHLGAAQGGPGAHLVLGQPTEPSSRWQWGVTPERTPTSSRIIVRLGRRIPTHLGGAGQGGPGAGLVLHHLQPAAAVQLQLVDDAAHPLPL